MTTFIIDTNALISFVTDRNVAQQKQMRELFEAATRLKCRICCPQNVITEFVYVMEKVYAVDPLKIQEMIRDFLGLTGVELLHHLDYKILLTIWPSPIHDFADAIVASVGRANRNAAIITFDKKLRAALKKLGIPTH